jgi:hypothetical protein
MVRLSGVLACALMLGGCASSSVSWMPSMDVFKGGGGSAELRLDSEPPGAEARTATGQACRTPCALAVPASDTSVTFNAQGFLPATVPVRVLLPGDPRTDPNAVAGVTLDPNPVSVMLEPAPPPPPPPKKHRRAKRKPPPPPAPAAQRVPMQPPMQPSLQPPPPPPPRTPG